LWYTPYNPALQDYAYWASAEQFFWPVGLTWSEEPEMEIEKVI